MREAAESLGDNYVELLEEMGRDNIERMQRMVMKRFEGQAKMTPSEWLLAIRRYRSATEGRDFSDMEREKALRLVFQQQRLYDRMSKLLETLSLTPAPDKESDPLGSITVRNTFNKRQIRLRGLKEEKLAQAHSGEVEGAINDLVEYTGEIIKLGEEFTTEVAEYSIASGIGKIDRQQLKDIHKVMGDLSQEINAVEQELGLKTDRSEETYQSKFFQTMQKAERFAKAHPRQYTWWCPRCNWEGLHLMRKPAEGSLINKLDVWWVWKCPECGTIIAYDHEHPLFDGKLLFWRRVWDLVKWGDISLKQAAYLHHCAPEHLVVAAQQIYREELPPHVQKEWDEIESESKVRHKDDSHVQEALPNSGEVEE